MIETKKISINIAGRNYPIIVEPKEEQRIKDIESDIKLKYLELAKVYSKLETQDILALMLINTMTEQGSNDMENPDHSNEIENLIATLENHLD